MDEYEIQLSSENVEENILLDTINTNETIELKSEEYQPVPVTSVNGKKGKVELTTEDIPNTSGYQTSKEVYTIADAEIAEHNGSASAHPFLRDQISGLSSQISAVSTQVDTKQDTLVSGRNIKTINDQSILGSGNLVIESGAEYGFTGIITGTSANPTDGASLANGTYIADPSKTSSYINLAMEDGTTKKQTVQKGGIVIRTAGRLIVLATQNLLYQYNTSQHYFYEGEPIVESYTRTIPSDDQAYLGTVAPPNNKIVTAPVYLLDGEVNTGTTGHVRIIFTVVDDLQGEDFAYSLTLASGDDILYEDGAEPNFKEGHTYMLEFYGSTCQVLDFTESTGYSRDDLLKRFMRQNSNQIYYPSLDSIPVITVTKAVFDSTTRAISIGESEDITVNGIHTLDYYNMVKYINLDLSPYNTNTQANMLQPYTQLPDGNYIVTSAGRVWFTTESYNCVPGEIIFKKGNEIAIIGLYGAVYYAYDTGTDEWSGGFFTTYADVQSMITETNPMKNWTIGKSTSATGNISMVNGKWTKKTRSAGITSGSCSTPNNLTEVPDTYKSRFTLRTASTFTTFTVTQKADYKIYFDGDDCANGSITMLANKYYDIQFEADGFGDIIGHVHSYTLPS